MPECTAPGSNATPIAIVGLACRFPDADDPLALFESALAGRRAFRRLPPGRLGAIPDPETGRDAGLPDSAAGSIPRAALLEGWQFDRAAFGIAGPTYLAADPAHWLALETAGRALADAGFPGGQGLAGDRAGVIIGNTLTGEVSRAAALRTRWPFVRAVLTTALATGDVPPAERARALGQATAAFAAVPEVTGETLAGSQSGAIADRICRHFGFRGGGQAVDTAHSSSLLAVASAAALLTAGELDFVLAGGVDISLDPFELGALAQAGVLATGAMRIYDASPTGFLPGEGCGMLALMRSADARAADMPVYAEIVGWGVSSAGRRDAVSADPDSQLPALQRAYDRAGVDPADIQLIEGDGRGTADGDLAELTALTAIRAGATAAAVLGSVKANIGHTKAAAGAAGLIKAALAVNAGVLPPVTGCARPHPMLADEDAVLRVPRTAESWPPGTRLAAVSSLDPAGSHVHVVLRREPNQAAFPQPAGTGLPPGQARQAGRAQPARTRPLGSWSVPGAPRPEIFAFSGAARETVAAQLAGVARVAARLSDSELGDLACQLGRQAARGPVRVAVVTASQDELARLAREAAGLLPSLAAGQLTARPGLFAADGAAGQVVLLFPGEASTTAAGQDWPGPGSQPAIVQASMSALGWLDSLGVRAAAALGHGVGEITGLVWAGSLAESDAAALVAQRAAVLAAPGTRRTAMICLGAGEDESLALDPGGELVIAAYHGPRCHVLAGPAEAVHDAARRAGDAGIQAYVLDVPHALHTPALADRVMPLRDVLAGVTFAAPSRRLLSTVSGREVTSAAGVRDLLCDQLVSPARFAEALASVDSSADLLVDTGPGQAMAALAAGCSDVPAVSLAAGPGGPAAADAVAALFAVGAIASLAPLLAGRPSRPIDTGRERIFITNPYALITAELASLDEPAAGGSAAGPGILARAAGPADAAEPAGAGDLPGGRADDPAEPGTPPEPEHSPRDAEAFPGVGPWVRCFSEELRAPRSPVLPVDEEPWQLHATTRQPFGRMAAEVFEDDPAATGVLAVIGDLADPDAAATLVTAAQEAVAAGALVVITPAAGLAGFCASLHAEHPTLGITLIRTSNSMAGLLAAQRYAAAEAGQFLELVLDTRSEPREPVMVAGLDHPPGDGAGDRKAGNLDADDLEASDLEASDPEASDPEASDPEAADPEAEDPEPAPDRAPVPDRGPAPLPVAEGPLGPGDIVLISGGSTLDLLATTRVLAGCGARLVLAGTAGPGEAAAIDVGLAVLRGAGADVSYVPADLSDPDEAETAIASVEQRVGQVTAVVHAASTGPLRDCLTLSGADLGAQIARQADGLSNVLGAVSAAGLRVLVTLGTVPARYGAARNCAPALAASALAEQARRLRPSLPGCRILHADWPWPGSGDQIRVSELARPGPLGVDDETAAELSRLLLARLADADTPGRVAMHGRLGLPGPAAPAPEAPAPGAPALGGLAAYPGQAAEIHGRFLQSARVYYPGVELVADTEISARTDPYLADHHIDGLMVLPLAVALEAMAEAASVLAGRPLRRLAGTRMDAPVVLLTGDRDTTLRVCALRRADAVETVLRCADSGFQVDHFRALFPLGPSPQPPGQTAPQPPAQAAPPPRDQPAAPWPMPGLGLTVASAGGVVDGTDLYGPVFFQAGPFRRVAFLPEVTSRSCSALVRGADDRPWFSGAPGMDVPLVLGSPGLNDAVMHMLQACVPHRRMLPAGFDLLTVSGAEVRGAVQVRAERQAGPDSGWQVTAVDAAGHTVAAVSGLRMRDVGPLEASAPWHPTLLAAALEGWAAEFGLDPAMRVTVSCGQPGQDRQPRAEGLPWLDASTGLGPLAGLQLTARASRPVACYWASVTAGQPASRPRPVVPLPADGAGARTDQASSRNENQSGQLARQLRERTGEPPDLVAARMHAITACLAAAGMRAGTPLALGPSRDSGWVQVEAGPARIACTITAIEGVRGPVVVALATWPAAIHDVAGHAARFSGHGAQSPGDGSGPEEAEAAGSLATGTIEPAEPTHTRPAGTGRTAGASQPRVPERRAGGVRDTA